MGCRSSFALAVGAYVLVGLAAPRYQAEATVQVAPVPVQNAAADSLDLRGATSIDFETYRALANSPEVLTAAAVPFGNERPPMQTLRSALALTRVSGNNSAALVVRHAVTDPDPELAAAVANAWAEATRNAALAAVVGALDNAAAGVENRTVQVRRDMDEAEAAWQVFQKEDNRADLRARIEALSTRSTEGRQRLDELERLQATAQAQQALLAAIVASSASTSTSATLDAQLQGLVSNGVLDPALYTSLLEALSATGTGNADQGLSLTFVIAQSKLQQLTADLAGFAAERAAITAQLATYDDQAAAIRTELARLERNAAELGRRLSLAEASYQQVRSLAPQISVVSDLAASGTRVLNQAVPADRAEPRRRGLTTLAAAAAGLVVGVFLVFFRAAVAEPKSTRPPAVSTPTQPQRRGSP